MKIVNDNWKRYAISIAVTFFAGFALAIVPNIDALTLASFKDGTLVGLIFAGFRTGIKFVLEAFLAWYKAA